MMGYAGDWDDVFDEAEAESFVGRENELEKFRQQIILVKPRYPIFYITGQGGAGKSTLLHRYQGIAEEHGFLIAECDEQQHDVPAVLGRFAQQLTEQGFPLKDFNERYKAYRQKMHEIECDPEAPQGLAATIARTMVRVAFIAGDSVPGMRKGLDYVPQETVETQASEWAAYLAKKFSNKDDVALVREPVTILTPLFFEYLNKIADKGKVLLCFDNFEATRSELQEWLLRLREYKPSLNIRIAIAGRDAPGAKWEPLQKGTQTIRLDVFTEQEAEAFLDTYNISNSKRREEILELSGRLPVLMSWLAAAGEGEEGDIYLPTHDIVERFLRWVTDPALKEVALLAAIPRVFNIDILKILLQDRKPAFDEQVAFDWLQTMPFVQQRTDGWRYHDVVRRMMLRYHRQKSPQMYRQHHTTLANYYDTYRNDLSLEEKQHWGSEEWRKLTLAYAYHFLASIPHKHWEEVLSLFVIAIRKRRAFAREMIELLNSEDVHDELTHKQIEMIKLCHQQLQAMKGGSLKDGFTMFDRLCRMDKLSAQARGYAFAYRGECHWPNKSWEKALSDFEKALNCCPNDVWIATDRGETYRIMGRFEDALKDFDQVITLDKKAPMAFINRGVLYRQMNQYQKSLDDFDYALTLDENNALAIAQRGETYRRMEQYQRALDDFDRAFTLNEKITWIITQRGITHRQMEHYEEALTDFDRAISLDERDFYAFAHRGITYRLMRYYEEALADFNRAIELDPERKWVMDNRADIYLLTRRYREALDYANHQIAINEQEDWYWYCRAIVYMLSSQTSAFESDIQHALELAQATLKNNPKDWRVAFNLAIYNLVSGSLAIAESRYAQLILTCPSLKALQGAEEDLTDLLEVQPSNELALLIRAKLQARIIELQQATSTLQEEPTP
jgi:tetratricopeptide (TPR) repeat protein